MLEAALPPAIPRRSRVMHRNLRSDPPVATGGSGVWLHTADGRAVLDASGGAAVSCLGHGHPRVVEAIQRQAATLAYAHTSFFSSEVMVPSIFSATGLAPLSQIVAHSVAMARPAPGFLDVTVFAGFSYADVPNCGSSVLAVADEAAEAARVTERLSEEVFAHRRELMHQDLVLDIGTAVDRAVARAAERPGRPIVLLEHADRCNDSTYLLRELLGRGISGAAVPYEDPFIQFGMRVQDFAMIVLRSKTHFRAAYEAIADSILIVDTPDWGPADLTTLPYRQIRRHVFPFATTKPKP